MKLDINDLFTFGGLALLAGGVGYEFTPAIAGIVIGTILATLGIWKA